MKYTYEVITNEFGENILRSDGAWIPKDLGNTDYQQYLATLSVPDKL